MPNLISKSVQTQGNWYTIHLQQEFFFSTGAVEMSTSFWRWLRSFLIWSLSLTLETGPRSPPISLRCLSSPSVKWYENLPFILIYMYMYHGKFVVGSKIWNFSSPQKIKADMNPWRHRYMYLFFMAPENFA